MIADIGYIMSCSDDEFEQVTGVRLSEDVWDRWSDDMDRRTEQLLALFVKAVKAEREACAKVCDSRAMEYDGFSAEQNASEKLAAAIRERGNT
jgi:hypothetical protein